MHLPRLVPGCAAAAHPGPGPLVADADMTGRLWSRAGDSPKEGIAIAHIQAQPWGYL